MITILHLIHKYRCDYPLLNSQVSLDPERFRTVVCYVSGANDGCNRIEEYGVKALYLNRNPDHMRWYNRSLLGEIAGLIDREQPHVVNAQQHRSVPLGVLATGMSRRKPTLVATLHGLGTAKTWQRKLFNRYLFKRLYRIIGISDGVAEDIRRTNWGLSPEKVVTVRNGLSYEDFYPAEEKQALRKTLFPELPEGRWFGAIGRLSPVKNHLTLVRAFADVVAADDRAQLLIAGDGDLRPVIEGEIASRNLQGHVHLLGFRQDVPEILRALDVFVLPSLREGLPLSLLEAMASGLPCVGARVGGIPEVFGDEKIGLLVDPQDAGSLTAAIKQIGASTEEDLAIMGQLARTRALDDFSAEQMIAGYEKVYTAAAAAFGGRG